MNASAHRPLFRTLALTLALGGAFLAGLAPSSNSARADEELTTEAADWNDKGIERTRGGDFAGAAEAFENALRNAPGHVTIKRNLALALGNHGVELLRAGKIAEAEDQTRRAFELDDQDPVLSLNLASCLDARGYPERAAVYVRRAARLGPEIAAVQEKLGSVHYREGDLPGAVAAWQKVLLAEPDNADLRLRVQRAQASIELQGRLHQQVSSNFIVHFDLESHAVLASNVIRELEEAHGIVAAEFQRFGPAQLRVFVLDEADFRRVTGAHTWVAGLYDGQIRLPVPTSGRITESVLAKARHEYVHAVLAPLGARAPSWLHEGLAQIREGKSVAQATKRATAAPALEFARLSASFVGTRNAREAQLLYDTALAFVAWLRTAERAAMFSAAVDALFGGDELSPAFEAGYDETLVDLYDAFQSGLAR